MSAAFAWKYNTMKTFKQLSHIQNTGYFFYNFKEPPKSSKYIELYYVVHHYLL